MQRPPELPTSWSRRWRRSVRHLAAERGVSGTRSGPTWVMSGRSWSTPPTRVWTSPDGLDIAVLRGWLAAQHATGRPGPRWPAGRVGPHVHRVRPRPRLAPSDRAVAGTPRLRRSSRGDPPDQMAAVLAAQHGPGPGKPCTGKPAPGSHAPESPGPGGSEPDPPRSGAGPARHRDHGAAYAPESGQQLCGLDL